MPSSTGRRFGRGPCRLFQPMWMTVCGIRSAPVLLIFAACRPGDSSPSDIPAPYSQRDSAGVMISVNTVSGSISATGWKVDPVPDLILGDAGTPSGTLYRIQGVEGLASGGTLVVDGGSRELRFFDVRGHILERVGGQGAGPGEFEDPVLVPWTDQDSLLVFDKRLPRFQVFSSGGEYSGAFRHLNGWPAGRVPPVGALQMQALFEVRRLREGEESEARSRLKQAFGEYFWYDMRNAERTALMSFVVDWAYETSGGTSDVPFSPTPTAAVGPRGAWITNGRDFEIRCFDSQGKIRHLIRVDEPKRPVTPRMVQTRIDVLTAQYPEMERHRLERKYSEVPLPDSLPAIQSLLVDDTGWLWAQRYQWDPSRPKEWIVFDKDGRAHGTVETPSGLDVKWIGQDRILGIWLDNLGVEYVRQHGLHRAVTDPPDGAGERGQRRVRPPGGSPLGAPGRDK